MYRYNLKNRRLTDERGVVLIMVLLIVSIVTILVLDFFSSAYTDLTIAESYRDSLKGEYIAKAGINAAKALLKEDKRATSRRYDSLDEAWGQPFTYPLNNGWVSVDIKDEERKININKLVRSNGSIDERWERTFKSLCNILEIEESIVDATIDWIDEDSNPMDYGAEEFYYASLEEGYLIKNSYMDTLNELRLVKGVTPVIFNRIAPYLTVKSSGKININTASATLLRSLSDDIGRDLAEDIVRYRQERPFPHKNRLADVNGIDSSTLSEISDLIDVTSDYFTIKTSTSIGEGNYSRSALVKRNSQNVLIEEWRAR